MFIALYRWKLKPGQEARFQEGWRRLTVEIQRRFGSGGSRLHRGEDGTWLAYAQWPDRQAWARAQGAQFADTEAQTLMQTSIETSFPVTCLEVVADLLSARHGQAQLGDGETEEAGDGLLGARPAAS